MDLHEAVYEYLKEHPDGASVPEMEAALSMEDKEVRSAIDKLRYRTPSVNIVNLGHGSKRFRIDAGVWRGRS